MLYDCKLQSKCRTYSRHVIYYCTALRLTILVNQLGRSLKCFRYTRGSLTGCPKCKKLPNLVALTRGQLSHPLGIAIRMCQGSSPANLNKYSMVNHDIQMASMRASFGLSMGSPSAFRCCTEGTVFRVMPTVEATTKTMDITEIT